jgi:inosine/xanthosine triphosphate pyrophosphatase family protein
MQVNSAVLNNMDKLLQVLSNQSNRNAQFKTVVTLNLNGKQYLFTGIASGEITLSKSEKKVSATILSFNLRISTNFR